MKRKGRRLALATSAAALIVLALAVYLGWPQLRAWAGIKVRAGAYPPFLVAGGRAPP
jgi:hypothetical protein